jgi:hypothetical protein
LVTKTLLSSEIEGLKDYGWMMFFPGRYHEVTANHEPVMHSGSLKYSIPHFIIMLLFRLGKEVPPYVTDTSTPRYLFATEVLVMSLGSYV